VTFKSCNASEEEPSKRSRAASQEPPLIVSHIIECFLVSTVNPKSLLQCLDRVPRAAENEVTQTLIDQFVSAASLDTKGFAIKALYILLKSRPERNKLVRTALQRMTSNFIWLLRVMMTDVTNVVLDLMIMFAKCSPAETVAALLQVDPNIHLLLFHLNPTIGSPRTIVQILQIFQALSHCEPLLQVLAADSVRAQLRLLLRRDSLSADCGGRGRSIRARCILLYSQLCVQRDLQDSLFFRQLWELLADPKLLGRCGKVHASNALANFIENKLVDDQTLRGMLCSPNFKAACKRCPQVVYVCSVYATQVSGDQALSPLQDLAPDFGRWLCVPRGQDEATRSNAACILYRLASVEDELADAQGTPVRCQVYNVAPENMASLVQALSLDCPFRITSMVGQRQVMLLITELVRPCNDLEQKYVHAFMEAGGLSVLSQLYLALESDEKAHVNVGPLLNLWFQLGMGRPRETVAHWMQSGCFSTLLASRQTALKRMALEIPALAAILVRSRPMLELL
jgi:hypothetical protein